MRSRLRREARKLPPRQSRVFSAFRSIHVRAVPEIDRSVLCPPCRFVSFTSVPPENAEVPVMRVLPCSRESWNLYTTARLRGAPTLDAAWDAAKRDTA